MLHIEYKMFLFYNDVQLKVVKKCRVECFEKLFYPWWYKIIQMNEISIFNKYRKLMYRIYLFELKILCTITDMLIGIFVFLTIRSSLRFSMYYWMNCIQRKCLYDKRKTMQFSSFLFAVLVNRSDCFSVFCVLQANFYWIVHTLGLFWSQITKPDFDLNIGSIICSKTKLNSGIQFI